MHQVNGQEEDAPKERGRICRRLPLDPALGSGFIIYWVNKLTMGICIVLANVAAIAVIFLIVVYLWLDKRRFHVERQFRAVEHLFDEWMGLASAVSGSEEVVVSYQTARNISEKYRAVGRMSEAVWGCETQKMKEIAGELGVFLGVYHALAEDYNRRLNSKITGRIATFLGFKKFPNIHMETEHV